MVWKASATSYDRVALKVIPAIPIPVAPVTVVAVNRGTSGRALFQQYKGKVWSMGIESLTNQI